MNTKERKEIIRNFEKQLHKEGASNNTIISYSWIVNDFYKRYEALTFTNTEQQQLFNAIVTW